MSVNNEISEVFISYSWQKESKSIANEIENVLKSNNINVIRDKNDIGYKGLIKEFMERLGRGRFIILIIGEAYLKSENCMYELLQIGKSENIYDCIFPIVLPSAKIYKTKDRLKYIHYWENELNELEDIIKKGRLTNLQGVFEELNIYSEIRRNIDSLTSILKNINSISIKHESKNDYGQLLAKLQEEMGNHTLEVVETKNQSNIIARATEELEECLMLLGANQKDIAKIILELENDENYYSFYSDDHPLISIVGNRSTSDNIYNFYKEWKCFLNATHLIRSSFYISRKKVVGYFRSERENILNYNLHGELKDKLPHEKLILLLQHFQQSGRSIFAPLYFYKKNTIPESIHPAIYLIGVFKTNNETNDEIAALDYNQKNITIGQAHNIIENSDPFNLPIIQLKGKVVDAEIQMELSRKYIPFTSTDSHNLQDLFAGREKCIAGMGSIKLMQDGSYRFSPLVCKFLNDNDWLDLFNQKLK